MSYVPPHKRGKAPLEMKDFPSLAGAGAGSSAGAGSDSPKYSAKASTPVTVPKIQQERKDVPTFVGSRFQKPSVTYKVAPDIEKEVIQDDGWVTVETKLQKKPALDSEWDGFDDY